MKRINFHEEELHYNADTFVFMLEAVLRVGEVYDISKNPVKTYHFYIFKLLLTGNILRGVFCERRSQKTRDIPREFMRLA